MNLQSRAIRLANGLLGRFGLRLLIDRPIRNSARLFALKSKAARVRTIFDVGAHVGEFSGDLRRYGYDGTIISVEPASAAHARLLANSASDPDWVVAGPMALGAFPGESALNISSNWVSSSLLDVQKASIDAAPESGYIDKEVVRVDTLDNLAGAEWGGPLALKIDTQGFELEVLRGATEALKRTAVVMLEMSLTSLYRGGGTFCEVYGYLETAGFRCIALTEGFADIVRNEVLQVDAVFVRDDPQASADPA